jgi:hypothetical protein
MFFTGIAVVAFLSVKGWGNYPFLRVGFLDESILVEGVISASTLKILLEWQD